MNSQDRSVIVTGAAGGIGSAICVRLHRDGYWLVGIDRDPPVVGSCDAFVALDLENLGWSDAAAADVAGQLRQHVGGRALHGVVHAAALQLVGDVESRGVEDLGRTLAVNVMAPYALTRSLVPDLRAAKGAVVFVTSIHARLTKPGFALYATSKAALSGLTRSLALDLAPEVRVNAVSPAAIDTAMLRDGFGEGWNDATARKLASVHPLLRIGQPAEVADAVAFMLSPQAAFITGSELEVGGGIHVCLHDLQ